RGQEPDALRDRRGTLHQPIPPAADPVPDQQWSWRRTEREPRRALGRTAPLLLEPALLERLGDETLNAAPRHLLTLDRDALRCLLLELRVRLGVLMVLQQQVELTVIREDPDRDALLGADVGALSMARPVARVGVWQIAREVDHLASDHVRGARGGNQGE